MESLGSRCIVPIISLSLPPSLGRAHGTPGANLIPQGTRVIEHSSLLPSRNQQIPTAREIYQFVLSGNDQIANWSASIKRCLRFPFKPAKESSAMYLKKMSSRSPGLFSVFHSALLPTIRSASVGEFDFIASFSFTRSRRSRLRSCCLTGTTQQDAVIARRRSAQNLRSLTRRVIGIYAFRSV